MDCKDLEWPLSLIMHRKLYQYALKARYFYKVISLDEELSLLDFQNFPFSSTSVCRIDQRICLSAQEPRGVPPAGSTWWVGIDFCASIPVFDIFLWSSHWRVGFIGFL